MTCNVEYLFNGSACFVCIVTKYRDFVNNNSACQCQKAQMLSVQIMGHMTFVYLRFSRTFVLQTINIYKLVPKNTHLAYNFKNYGRDSGQPQKKIGGSMAHAYKIWQCTAQWSSSAHPERHARRPHVRNKMSLIFGPLCTCMHHSVRGNVFSCLKYLITKRWPTYIISTQLRLYSLHKAPIQTQCNIHTRDVRNIFFLFRFGFWKKTSVQFKKRGSVRIL